jgi:4-amino-4-deoxychorismate lyase
MNASRKELFNASPIDLFSLLQAPKLEISPGLFKCRIIYSQQIETIEFIPYQIPNIKSLKLVVNDSLDYSHKYLNRKLLEKLFSQKGNCDDVVIVKNGFVTDTSFANVLFFNGKNWLTPAKPLLKGTQRQFLLENEQIGTADIHPSDLKYFQKMRLVNAMIRFEDEVDVEIENIV